jgi:hypothetical protein
MAPQENHLSLKSRSKIEVSNFEDRGFVLNSASNTNFPSTARNPDALVTHVRAQVTTRRVLSTTKCAAGEPLAPGKW